MEDTIVDRRTFRGILTYLVLSAVASAVVAVSATLPTIRAAFIAALLVGFLIVAKLAVARIASLDEFGQLLAWRALAVAGIVTVWFDLLLGLIFWSVYRWTQQFDPMLVIVIGPPLLWLTTGVLLRQAERAYR